MKRGKKYVEAAKAIIGTLWFMYIMKMSFSASLIICVLPFLPGDVLKIFIAAALTNKFKNIIKD